MSLEDLARRDADELLYRGLDAVVKEIPRIAEMATQEERAAVVKWLRAEAYLTLYEAALTDIAAAIERGQHRREEEK